MNTILSILLLISIPILIHFLKKKIEHQLWFLKVRYVFRIIVKSMILVGLAYTFVTTSFAYLTYPKYIATTDGYYEYNSTSEEGIERVMYQTIYKFQVEEKTLRITDKSTSSGQKPREGKSVEVLYSDGDFMVYHPILFLIGTLIGIGVFYYVHHLIKSDFIKKPLMPKESFWGHNTTRESSFSFSLNREDREDE